MRTLDHVGPSSTPDREPVRLVVRADSVLTEILVFDGRFRPVQQQSLGRLELDLAPGLYKVEFRVGDRTTTRYVALSGAEPEVTVAIGPDDLVLPTASTVPETSGAPNPAVSISQSIANPDRDKGQIMVFVHAPDGGGQDGRSLISGLSLYDGSGALTVKLADQAESGPDWAGAVVEVVPGSYRLRCLGRSGRVLEQSLAASAGWQTQIFLVQHDPDDTFPICPSDSSVYLAPSARGFDPARPGLRWIEQARRWLAEGRDVLAALVPESGRGARRWLKFAAREPMLGLLCIHLLRRRLARSTGPTPPWILDLVREAAEVIRRAVGDHPDLRALDAWLAPNEVLPSSCADPPMLRDSWQSALDAKAVGPDDLSARITGRIWGASPWLIWEYAPEIDRARPARPRSVTDHSEMISRAPALVVQALAPLEDDPEKLSSAVNALDLNRSQTELLGYLWHYGQSSLQRLHRTATRPLDRQPSASEPSTLTASTLVSAMMAPSSVIGQTLETLMARIVPDRPHTRRLLDGPWPPDDGVELIYSEHFGELLGEIVAECVERFHNMDFTDALPEVFFWFDRKLSEVPDFLNGSRFKTPASFLAYVRQALWNAARLTDRQRQRHDRRLEPLDLDREAATEPQTPEEAVALFECIETLPLDHRTVIRRLFFDPEATVESLARELRTSPENITRMVDAASDVLAANAGLNSKRRGKR